jgi:PKD repeat protein
MNTISDSVRVTVLPKLKVQNPLIPKVCEGSVLRLVGNAFYGKQPYLYSWLDPLNLSIFSTKDSLYIPSAKVSSYWLNAVDQCANRDSVLVQLNPDISPKADFNILDSVICADDIVKIENTSSNSQLLPMNYYWKWLNGSSTAQTPLPLLKTSGQYDLMLVTTLQNNCSDTFSKKNAFIVHPKPKANFTTDKTIVSKNDAFIQFSDLSLTQGLSNYLWNFGDGKISTETNPQNSFLNAGWYSVSLVVTNEFVCSDSINKYHLIWVQGEKSIYMPNAITLNNDGLNEDFKPYGDDVKSWQMEVYDRSGNEVFAGNQDTGGFKGKDRNSIPLSIGVYIYRVAVTTGDNETYYFKGTITILR